MKQLLFVSLLLVSFAATAQHKRNPCESEIGIVGTVSTGYGSKTFPFNLELTAWWPQQGLVAGVGLGNYVAPDGEKTGYDSRLLPYATAGVRFFNSEVFKTYVFTKINTALAPTLSVRGYAQVTEFMMLGVEPFIERNNHGINGLLTIRFR